MDVFFEHLLFKKTNVYIIMSFTRFKDDPCRIKKELQELTGLGRYMLNVPGNGDKPGFMEDPHIRMQKWGSNLMTNTVNLESDLNSNESYNKKYTGYTITSSNNSTKRVYIENWVLNIEPKDWKHAKSLFDKYLKKDTKYNESEISQGY